MSQRYSLDKFSGLELTGFSHHQEQSTILEKEENTKMKMKIYKLEKIVHEMTENIIQLGSKV